MPLHGSPDKALIDRWLDLQSFDKLFVITNSNNPDGQMPVAEAAPGRVVGLRELLERAIEHAYDQYRSGQRFGAAHLVDILLGKETEKVLQEKLKKLKTLESLGMTFGHVD